MDKVELWREGNILHIEGVDILDGTPLLDIKPYSNRFDARENSPHGWMDTVPESEARKKGRRDYRGASGKEDSLFP